MCCSLLMVLRTPERLSGSFSDLGFHRSTVSIIHVAEIPKLPPSFVSYAAFSGRTLGAFRKEITMKARGLVSDTADVLSGRAVRINTMVRHGVPQVEMLDVIAKKKLIWSCWAHAGCPASHALCSVASAKRRYIMPTVPC